ncbi:MAG TPA: helix-turn-helix domain-containing protein [Acidimicrobiales bacterium]|nr:helix-turn-helix domain-containing protein [Acidimicrobiales bacterium]
MDEVSPALESAMATVGDRWSLLVVAALMGGPRRFGELLESVVGVAPNILASRLRHLERQGVVVSRPYSERPPRVDYQLTARGHDLAGAIRLLTAWEANSAPAGAEPASPPRHQPCGTPMEPRWWCPTCGRNAEDDEADLYWI